MKNDHDVMFAPLETAIGYSFRDKELLVEALTHRSRTNESAQSIPDNQRLEFFGDSILGFLVSRELFLRFPQCREGELTRMRATLVDEENLARIAVAMGLGAFLQLGRGEVKSGGKEKKSILADACEAVIAAVYLDGGMVHARSLVKRHFVHLFATGETSSLTRDYKTELQELTQSRFASSPRYELLEATGPDHERSFRIAVLLDGKVLGEGQGSSKKMAQQAAAREAMGALSG